MWDGGGETCRLHSCSWLSSITARQLGAGARPLRHSSDTRDSSVGVAAARAAGVPVCVRGVRLLAALRGKRVVSAAVLLEAGYGALCYEMWVQQSQTSSRHGWPRATASTNDESAAQGRASLRSPRQRRSRASGPSASTPCSRRRRTTARAGVAAARGGRRPGGGEDAAPSAAASGAWLRLRASQRRFGSSSRWCIEALSRHCRVCRAARTRAVRL